MSDLAPFGPKTAWVAVLDRSAADVAEALGVSGGRPVTVAEAVEADVDTGVLPPLPGVGGHWTLAVSGDLADISPTRLATLSAMLGTSVHAFATHRVVEAHRWLAAEDGVLRRHLQVLGESGELKAWSGEPTAQEVALGLPATATIDGDDVASEVVRAVDEEVVLAVAAAWSVDPMSLSGPAPGSAFLFAGDDAGSPLPEPLPPLPLRQRGLWSRLTGR